MRIRIAAVGRLRAGPEKALVDDYLNRFHRTGRNLGLTFDGMIEVEDRKQGGPAAEAALLRSAIPDASLIWILDERGRTLTSPELADTLAGERDGTGRDVTFVIGGADGFDSTFRDMADRAISFGPMVWPHMLARVMLSEQLYRAATILAGTPYHRA